MAWAAWMFVHFTWDNYLGLSSFGRKMAEIGWIWQRDGISRKFEKNHLTALISLAFLYRFGCKLVCDQGLDMGWLMPICSLLASRMPEILPVSRDVHMSLVTFLPLYIMLWPLFWAMQKWRGLTWRQSACVYICENWEGLHVFPPFAFFAGI